MRYLVILFFIVLASCASQESVQREVATAASGDSADTEQLAPRHRRVYYFEHRLIPNWLHNSDGSFFYDLANGNTARLVEEAGIVVDDAFADALNITFKPEHDAIIFAFESPRNMPNCYFAIAQYSDNGYFYTTYERTMQFDDGPSVGGIVGQWTADGSHLNLGGRLYTSLDEFVADVLNTEPAPVTSF